jgi:hypothetical protein
MASQFDPVASLFIEKTRSVLPAADVRDIYWAFHFLLGAMIMTFAETGRIDRLSAGACRSADLDSIQAKMVPFLAAGFRAICIDAQSFEEKPGMQSGDVA